VVPGAALPEAVGHLEAALFSTALRLGPDYADAHYNLGVALSQVPGRTPEAIAECQAALRMRPDYAEAHNNLGNLLSQIPGRMPDAIAEYEAALRLKPNPELRRAIDGLRAARR
jgi:tetratricopeptide (TPR) repeat protein